MNAILEKIPELASATHTGEGDARFMPDRLKRSLPGPLAIPSAFLLGNIVLFSAITYFSLGGTPALVTWLKSNLGGLVAVYTILVLTLIIGNLVSPSLKAPIIFWSRHDPLTSGRAETIASYQHYLLMRELAWLSFVLLVFLGLASAALGTSRLQSAAYPCFLLLQYLVASIAARSVRRRR
jgi:hypothetical protein